jgi:hypothetical protein
MNKNFLLFASLSPLLISGCVSNNEIGSNTRDLLKTQYEYNYKWITIVEDEVIAFGQPKNPLPNIPEDSIVVAGQKYSYVITQGGAAFLALMNQLDTQYIQINRNLNFQTPSSDSNQFSGAIQFTYTPTNRTINPQELALLKKYGISNCSCNNIEELDDLKKLTFDIQLSGTIYPVANNIHSFKKLSKPYQIKIQNSQNIPEEKKIPLIEKIVFTPFAITFDIIALPVKALGIIYQP